MNNIAIFYNESLNNSDMELVQNELFEVCPIFEITVINKDHSERSIIGTLFRIECNDNQISFINCRQQILEIKLENESTFENVILCRQIIFRISNGCNISNIKIDLSKNKIVLLPLLKKDDGRSIGYFFTNDILPISTINSKRVFEVCDNGENYNLIINDAFKFSISYNDACSKRDSVPSSKFYIINEFNNGLKFERKDTNVQLWVKHRLFGWKDISDDVIRFFDLQCDFNEKGNLRMVFDATLDSVRLNGSDDRSAFAKSSIRLIDLILNY